MFIETSAKGGFNVKALFRKLALALPGAEPNPPVDVKLKPAPVPLAPAVADLTADAVPCAC